MSVETPELVSKSRLEPLSDGVFAVVMTEVGVAGVMKALGRKALVRTPAPKVPLKITAVETQLAFVAA
jgi:hypothetical protein